MVAFAVQDFGVFAGMETTLRFIKTVRGSRKDEALVIIGRKRRLAGADVRARLPRGLGETWRLMIKNLSGGDRGGSTRTWCGGSSPRELVAGVLPTSCSRHNSPGRPDAIQSLISRVVPKKGAVRILVALDEAEHALAAGCAIARAFPRYNRRSAKKKRRTVTVGFLCENGSVEDVETIATLAEAVRGAGELTDMPASELTTDAFVERAREVAASTGSKIKVIRGKALAKQGMGGLWGVGKAAVHPPALVVLSHEPKNATNTVVWVGKGIVYDTGGLSIKTKTGMPGMKADMGGAAAVLQAFSAAAQLSATSRIHALLCLAENSVGPDATRPDDILTLYSGKTVEVNNTDAEGRLVLGDGVAYASKHLEPDVIVDLATLTGAQLMATGRKHAAIVCNDDALEADAIAAGKSCGDLVHPLPYCPEFYKNEFSSRVADMKNSVKDRMNAQSSCAAQFVANHLTRYDGPWLHVDLAGPAVSLERGTGFGVALLVQLFCL